MKVRHRQQLGLPIREPFCPGQSLALGTVTVAILFRAAAETLATIAADSRHLGAQLGMTMVLHT
jgi:hypothetical protein